jgi:photosystem II stability/assembly factor-like uncharacterized protein
MFPLRLFFLLLFIFLSTPSSAQWSVLPVPGTNRYDDIFFISDSVGWAVASNGTILHTKDAGASWETQTDIIGYLRSIEFATPLLGFAGSLNGKFLKTTNGGANWTDIALDINPPPPGICGLSAPTPDVIYGCGIWSSPAYIIRSFDAGQSWTTTDMSALSSALVDIYFITPDTGWVSGKSPGQHGVGIILYTTDGGQTWSNLYTSDQGNEYIWKLQSPDGKHFFGAVANESFTGSTRMAFSIDRGLTWSTKVIDETFHYIQTIGFLDSLRGWTGGDNTLLETNDGGLTWKQIVVGNSYNRFLKINDSTAYMTGGQLYKYEGSKMTAINDPASVVKVHSFGVYPNPAKEHITIELDIKEYTPYWLRLYDINGLLIKSISQNPGGFGKESHTIPFSGIPSKVLYVVLTTNEGAVCRKVIRV